MYQDEEAIIYYDMHDNRWLYVRINSKHYYQQEEEKTMMIIPGRSWT
ncbi:MAG: hypothetical protein P857_701 [Candidatus Xenolissoclinum pacificiensis L6]|uniref:Uncharacterized protein n=1 Tax=Candidatus Xenolissoclinum pacificiensis L6 TaxID=1401685 RepID=W2UYN8_9RICK|nr:MAG: hypothetical protein P857_701 [Candidatus Xenolissoclinum pacificiensis L6]